MDSSLYATRYHRDGTVTFWDVYTQGWRRVYAIDLMRSMKEDVLSTLPARERRRIALVAIRSDRAHMTPEVWDVVGLFVTGADVRRQERDTERARRRAVGAIGQRKRAPRTAPRGERT